MFKKLLLLTVCLLGMNLHAENKPLVSLGPISLEIPFKETRATYLYDYFNKESLIGIETPVANFWGLEAVGGVITTFKWKGVPFAGINLKASEKLFFIPLNLGAWLGYDFTGFLESNSRRLYPRRFSSRRFWMGNRLRFWREPGIFWQEIIQYKHEDIAN